MLRRFFSILARCVLALAVFGITWLSLPARPASAAAYIVNWVSDNTTADGKCTLREAILAANDAPANTDCGAGSSGDDIITFNVSTVTISLTSTLPTIVAGQGTLTIDGGGSIIISGDSDGNGTGDVRVFSVDPGANLLLQNLTVYKGKGSSGGGIYNSGTVTISNSTLSSNSATSNGGGIYNIGTLVVISSTLTGNSSTNSGSGIYSEGTLTVTNSLLSNNNSSSSAGGIWNAFGRLTLTNSTLSNNTAAGDGGGLLNQGTLTITLSTFSNNTASADGGGLLNSSAATVTNSTFYGNSADLGGGILNNGTITVTNSTLFGNTAGSGGGINRSSGTATIKNTLVANNTGGNCAGTFAAGSTNNMADDATCGATFTQVASGQLNLGALTGNPAYYPLNTGSTAIDAGTNVGCPADSQNGVARPQDGNGDSVAVCDIGAYELQPLEKFYLPYISK